jgi:hypothetical protein
VVLFRILEGCWRFMAWRGVALLVMVRLPAVVAIEARMAGRAALVPMEVAILEATMRAEAIVMVMDVMEGRGGDGEERDGQSVSLWKGRADVREKELSWLVCGKKGKWTGASEELEETSVLDYR